MLWLVTATCGDPDCECVRCAYCTVLSNKHPKDQALKDHMALLSRIHYESCLDGTNSQRHTCGPNGVCLTQWGKYLISAQDGEAVVYDCIDRFCQDITGAENIYTDGCRMATNNDWSDHQIARFLSGPFGTFFPTLSATYLELNGCTCHECESCNSLSAAENCLPVGQCDP